MADSVTRMEERTMYSKGQNPDGPLFSLVEAEQQIHHEITKMLPKIEAIAHELKATGRNTNARGRAHQPELAPLRRCPGRRLSAQET